MVSSQPAPSQVDVHPTLRRTSHSSCFIHYGLSLFNSNGASHFSSFQRHAHQPLRGISQHISLFALAARKLVNKVQFSSVAQTCPTLCDSMDCSRPGFPVLHQLPELAQTHVHQVSDAIQPSHPRQALLQPSIFPSIRVFFNESILRIRWPKYWSFSFSISPSNEYSGLISFRMDWLDLLAVQGTLKSLLQHHSSKVSIL